MQALDTGDADAREGALFLDEAAAGFERQLRKLCPEIPDSAEAASSDDSSAAPPRVTAHNAQGWKFQPGRAQALAHAGQALDKRLPLQSRIRSDGKQLTAHATAAQHLTGFRHRCRIRRTHQRALPEQQILAK